MASNGYLGEVFPIHEDENTDSLMKMLSDVEDRTSRLMHQVQEMISATYGEFTQVPREARLMIASSKVIAERVEALEAKITTIAVPKLKNSTSVLNELSKRFSEISLTRKIVDELIELNHEFVAAQDLQREKKYLDAVKSFQTLHVNLKNASNDVKDLNIFPLLKAETTQSRANLLELMTYSLEKCFLFRATPGIDASRITYYTLKVAKNRTDDMEESFQALHYLGKLSVFFAVFADWLKKNIMLPIILHHCTVSTEDEDGKYMVLKIEADYTLPKCDFMKVFENLTFALTFLNTYLSVSIGRNYTLMNELGKLTSDDFNSALISNCLADTIPSHSNQLEEFKAVIIAVEQFDCYLKTIGFLDEENTDLTNYSTNAEKLCAKKTAKLLLIRAREIMKKDLYDVMEMEILPEALLETVKTELHIKEEEVLEEETPEKDQNMLAEMQQMELELVDEADTPEKICTLNKNTPSKEESEKIQSLVKCEAKEKDCQAVKDSANMDSSLTKDLQQKKSPVNKDLKEEKSPVREESNFYLGQIERPEDKHFHDLTSEATGIPFEGNEPDQKPVKECVTKEISVLAQPKKLLGETTQVSTMDESSEEEIILETSAGDSIFEAVPNEKEANFNLSGAIYAFPKCQISKSANELISLINEVLNDCIGSSSKCGRNLFKTARQIVELYCAIAPIYHKKYLETIPQQAALFHNNCLYIAHCLLTMGHFQRILLPDGIQTIGSFADQVPVLRNKGASVFLAHMHFQRNQILDIIRNCGLSTLGECSTLTSETERALRQCLRQLELLKSVWQPVLPTNVYTNTMACLMNSFLDELINRVITVQDIPAETASLLVKMFGVVITRVKAIFPDPKMLEEFEKWEMFQELVLILGASMMLIKDRWANGRGPTAIHFSSEQLRQLIRALFQNTERRAAILAEIH